MTTSEASLEEYLQWLLMEKGRSRTTVEAYRRDLGALLAWSVAKKRDADALAEEDLERYFNELRSSGRAASTVARAMAATRGWYGFIVEEGHRGDDPTTRLRGGRGRTLPKPLSENEVLSLLDSITDATAKDLRDKALLELLYGTGARVSEVVGLDLSDLDFDEELILVTGKGSKQRLVPMGRALRAALVAYLAPGGRDRLLGKSRDTGVFLNTHAGPLTRQGIDHIIHRRALEVGIDRHRVSAHVFRHSCATHMLAHGADIRVVQELLGHASIATTQRYTAVATTTLQREYTNAHPRAHD